MLCFILVAAMYALNESDHPILGSSKELEEPLLNSRFTFLISYKYSARKPKKQTQRLDPVTFGNEDS